MKLCVRHSVCFQVNIIRATARTAVSRDKMVLSMNSKKMKYLPLMLFQLILVVLFFVFVRYHDASHYQKNLEQIQPGTFEGTHVMIFIGFGFLMTFLKKYSYSALGFNWLLAALTVQWALLCQNFFTMENNTIYVTKKSLLEADIMSATVLITFGAVLGLASGLQLLLIAVIEVVIASLNLWLVTSVFKAADVGGSIAIHTFGAYFGLAASWALRFKKTEDSSNAPAVNLNGPSYTSDVTAMIGSIFLWIYWPSFNSGLTQTPAEYEMATVNTYLSLAAATVTTFFVSSAVNHGKLDMVHIQNSTLAGGVAVGSVCNMHINPGGAVVIGVAAGLLSVLGYKYLTPKLEKCGVPDTCGVNNLHGMPGLLSGVLTILLAALATKDGYGMELSSIFSAMTEEGGRAASSQALYQLAALGSTVALALLGGIFSGLIARTSMFEPLKQNEKYDDELNWELP